MEIIFKMFARTRGPLRNYNLHISPGRRTPRAKCARECLCVRKSTKRDAVRKKISLVVDAGKTGLHHFSHGDLAMRRSEGSKFAHGVIPILQDV